MAWDVFISHASEDKKEVAEPLKRALEDEGLSVWMDASEIELGDSMRLQMENGLGQSRWGVVIVSPAFLGKYWTQSELDGLFGLEGPGRKVILPVYYQIGPDEVRAQHPMLAAKKAVFWRDGLARVASEILGVVGRAPHGITPATPSTSGQGQKRGEVVLVMTPDEKTLFLECEKVTVADTVILVLKPTDRQVALVSSLRQPSAQKYTAVVFGLQSAIGHVQTLVETRERGSVTWLLTLKQDGRFQEHSFGEEISLNGVSADELAEKRARRILFDERLETKPGEPVDPMLEVLVRGMGVPVQVVSSPLPELFRKHGHSPGVFLNMARLSTVLWLRLSGVVEQIFALDLSLEAPAVLKVHFEGMRRREYANREPHIIRLDGTCDLQAREEPST
jgi:TIR domain